MSSEKSKGRRRRRSTHPMPSDSPVFERKVAKKKLATQSPVSIDLTLISEESSSSDEASNLFFKSVKDNAKARASKKTSAKSGSKFILSENPSVSFAAPEPNFLKRSNQDLTTVDRGRLWIEKYAPHDVAHLAVHKKKVESVKSWLEESFKSFSLYGSGAREKILIVTGPPGCAKSATVSVLSNVLNFEIVEWINPGNEKRAKIDGSFDRYENQMQMFSAFLLRAQHYKSLKLEGEESISRKKVILVEDVPFLEAETEQLELFRVCLNAYIQKATFPLIFILCDTSSGSSSLDFILGDLKNQKMRYGHITFREINLTLMTQTLKRVLSAEEIDLENEKLIFAQIHEESKGDIRAALNSLQMFCVGESASSGTDSKAIKKRSKKKQLQYSNLGDRDSTFSIFRGLGKVFHAKRNERTNELLVGAEEISAKMVIDSSLTQLFLHENYPSFFQNIEHVVCALDHLCDADILLAGNEQRDFSLESISSSVAIRGFLNPEFSLLKGRYQPFYRAKARDFEMIRKSSRATANVLFRGNAGSALGDFSHVLLEQTLPMVGTMVLRKSGEKSPEKSLLPVLDNAQVQFVYSHCVFNQPAPRRGAQIAEEDGAKEHRTYGASIEAENLKLVELSKSIHGTLENATTDDFDPICE